MSLVHSIRSVEMHCKTQKKRNGRRSLRSPDLVINSSNIVNANQQVLQREREEKECTQVCMCTCNTFSIQKYLPTNVNFVGKTEKTGLTSNVRPNKMELNL